MKKLLPLLLLSLLLAGSVSLAKAGDKTKRILRNVLAMESKILLVPTLVPDPFRLEKLRSKKDGEVKAAEYLQEVEKANANLRQYMDENFDYTQYKFLDLTAETYSSELKAFDNTKYAVLQFGTARQYATNPPEKLSSYYTQTFGIYETDLETVLMIIPGRQDQFHRKDVAQSIILRLNETLHKTKEKARRKGITPPKTPGDKRID